MRDKKPKSRIDISFWHSKMCLKGLVKSRDDDDDDGDIIANILWP